MLYNDITFYRFLSYINIFVIIDLLSKFIILNLLFKKRKYICFIIVKLY